MAAGKTYEPIATNTLGSAAASVTFSSIPQGYTDLVLVTNIGDDGSSSNTQIRFNSDSASNYSYIYLSGDGTSAYSGRYSNQPQIIIDNYSYPTTNITTSQIVQIQNYSNSTTYKTLLARTGTAANATTLVAGLWRNTAAISTIQIICQSFFDSGSTFTLYGIAAA
jgi:hypothetical protein